MGDSHTFLLHRYTRNWISNIGLGYIILFYYVMLCYIVGYMLFLSMLIFDTILLKNVLNVSACSLSSAIVVFFFFFNVMHSLSKEKRDYSNQFSIISNYFLVKFPKWSHLILRRIFMRCLFLLKKLFASFFLSHKYFVSKF